MLNDRRLIDANEASRVCGLSKATIYKLVQQGRLSAFKVLTRTLRFDTDDIRALLRRKPSTVPCEPAIADALPARPHADDQAATEVR